MYHPSNPFCRNHDIRGHRYTAVHPGYEYTPCLHTLSTHPVNTPYQHTLSPHPVTTPYQHTLSTYPVNTPYQRILSPYSINKHTLSIPSLSHKHPYTYTLSFVQASGHEQQLIQDIEEEDEGLRVEEDGSRTKLEEGETAEEFDVEEEEVTNHNCSDMHSTHPRTQHLFYSL